MLFLSFIHKNKVNLKHLEFKVTTQCLPVFLYSLAWLNVFMLLKFNFHFSFVFFFSPVRR